jgi:hypothetical protein
LVENLYDDYVHVLRGFRPANTIVLYVTKPNVEQIMTDNVVLSNMDCSKLALFFLMVGDIVNALLAERSNHNLEENVACGYAVEQ